MLNSILSSQTNATISLGSFLICLTVSLILGILCAWLHAYKNRATKSFLITLCLIPMIVQVIITLVNGNLGTGVAVMGAFSLVRFRSVPGNAREIASIFLAMTIGLANGMGYIGIAALLFVFIAVLTIAFLNISIANMDERQRNLHITIPENLDYNGIFDEIFETYTTKSTLIKAKTVNMGSLFDLHYEITLKNVKDEKAFLDALRCRNGNLSISCGRIADNRDEL